MWKTISQMLAEQFGAYYVIKHKQPIHNTPYQQSWLIDDGMQPVLVKSAPRHYRSKFRAEADQFALLTKTQSLCVPRVYGVGCAEQQSFILLEAFRPFAPLNFHQLSAESLKHFGQQLAKLHQWQPQQQYGLDFDTWLGKVYQPNEWKSNWATFFSEQRIGWQLQLCQEQGIYFGDIDKITQAIAHQLAKHNPVPALLQGALWQQNCFVLSQANIAKQKQTILCYSPACYWGDRECDLALTELQGFPLAFYQGYQQSYPLDSGYLQRKPIYQLYYLLHLIQHQQKEYLEQAQQIIDLFR